MTTFLSSHDAQEIRSLCAQISVIAKGRLVFTGPVRELGADLDAFEERLIGLLTAGRGRGLAGREGPEPLKGHCRAVLVISSIIQ